MTDQAVRAVRRCWWVPPELSAHRLNRFVSHCLPHLSRRSIDQMIGEKSIRINGRVGKKGDRIVAGDCVSFTGNFDRLAEQPLPTAAFETPVIYEDDSILVFNKPGSVATHGFSGSDRGTLANLIAARWPELLEVGKSRWEPGLLHRLDIETSGLILFAKTQAAFDRLRLQFRRREIGKTYLALVWGDADAEGIIDFALAHDSSDRRKMRTVSSAARGKQLRSWRALTQYRKIGAAQGMSLLQIVISTGVTHQIRVHLAAIGCPIVGDVLYGPEGDERFGLSRHFLHAKGLEFNHPSDQRRIRLEAEMPRELMDVLERLGIKF